MRKAITGVAALFLLASGCTSEPSCPKTPADAPIEHIAVRSPGNFTEVALQGGRIFGPDFDVVRCNQNYRGTAVRRQIDLQVQPDIITGIVGSGRTELRITKFADGFQVKGLYAGKMGDLVYRSGGLDGQLGGRVYHLRSVAASPAAAVSTTAGEPAAAGAPPANQEAAGSSAPSGPAPDKGRPATWTGIEIPASFLALPPEHQAATLAIFLGR